MRDPINIPKLKGKLTTAEERAHNVLQNKTSRMWRDFWVVVMHRHGYSNVAIAEELGMSESNVRVILAKPRNSL